MNKINPDSTETEVIEIQSSNKTDSNQNIFYIIIIVVLLSIFSLIIFQSVKSSRIGSPINEFLSSTTNTLTGTSDYEKQKSLILDILKKKYIGDLPNQNKISQGELEGLVASVGDKYTSYLSCDEYKAFQDDLNQNFDGIGARFKQEEDYIVVDETIPQSPAFKSGMKKGDILVNVDGQSADDISFSKIIDKIRGKAGTAVKLEVDRPNQEIIDTTTTYTRLTFSIERQSIHVDAVVLENRGDIAWIKISTFSKEVDSQMNLIAAQIRQNPNFKYVVLDLRDNGGGLLDQSVQLSSYFLNPNSVVVQEKNKQGIQKQNSVPKANNLVGYPLMVAINQGSASASEITAGALQDAKVAKIIGKTSYGKGVVQEIVDLSGCDKIKLTVAEWLTPNGSAINDKGITPDIRITRGQDYEAKIRENFSN